MSPGKRRADRPFPRWIPWVLVALMVVAIPVGYLLTRTTTTTQTENANLQGDKSVLTGQRDAAAGQALDLAGQIAAACASGNIPDDYRGACAKAQQVQAQPIPPVEGQRGPGPTAEEIRGAVAAYLVANPPPAGRAPTPAEVAAAVIQYLTANPPTPGRPPTSAEIASAVSTYFVTNPPRDGKDAPAPTAEQIQAAVDNYLAAHPPPAGKDGKDGATGPTCPTGSSLQSVTYADGRSGLGCVLDQQPAATPTNDPTAGEMPGG